jgi:hypothetical protein
MLTRSKDLHRLRAPMGGHLQQPCVQALIHEQVGRQNAQLGHKFPWRRMRAISQYGAPSIVAFL